MEKRLWGAVSLLSSALVFLAYLGLLRFQSQEARIKALEEKPIEVMDKLDRIIHLLETRSPVSIQNNKMGGGVYIGPPPKNWDVAFEYLRGRK